MTRSKTEGWLRLGTGVVLNAVLWPLTQVLSKWSSYDREAHLAILTAAVAAAALVSVIPLFWRGQPWQSPIAFVLIWLPAFALYGVVSLVITYS
jgi:hypothetical protein